MKKNKIDDFSLKELKKFRSFIDDYINLNSIKVEIDEMIEKKESNLNQRFTIEFMEEKKIFDSELINILKFYNIKNIQDLIDSDLESWDITKQRRLELEEAKIWYDFSRIEDKKSIKK